MSLKDTLFLSLARGPFSTFFVGEDRMCRGVGLKINSEGAPGLLLQEAVFCGIYYTEELLYV